MKFPQTAIVLLVILGFVLGCKTISKMTAAGGTELIVRVRTNEPNKEEIAQRAIKHVESRLDSFKMLGEVAEIAGAPDRISVKIYDPADQKNAPSVERVKELLFASHELELKKIVAPPASATLPTYPTEAVAAQNLADNQEVLPYAAKAANRPAFLIVEKTPIITGADVAAAEP